VVLPENVLPSITQLSLKLTHEADPTGLLTFKFKSCMHGICIIQCTHHCQTDSVKNNVRSYVHGCAMDSSGINRKLMKVLTDQWSSWIEVCCLVFVF